MAAEIAAQGPSAQQNSHAAEQAGIEPVWPNTIQLQVSAAGAVGIKQIAQRDAAGMEAGAAIQAAPRENAQRAEQKIGFVPM